MKKRTARTISDFRKGAAVKPQRKQLTNGKARERVRTAGFSRALVEITGRARVIHGKG